MNPIYLDYCATTPMDPSVVETVAVTMAEVFGNPSSRHVRGYRAKAVIDAAREQVAELVGASSSKVTFTSGATEALNIALRGWVGGTSDVRHAIVSTAEHKAVLQTMRSLEADGVVRVSWVDPAPDGRVLPGDVERLMETGTGLLVAMWANNETGTLNPVRDLAALCKGSGIHFVCDATQAVGKVPVSVDGIDALVLSGHKFYGPKGVGALVVDRRFRSQLAPFFMGGGQEHGLRSGTPNVPAIAGLGVAAELAGERLERDGVWTAHLRDQFERGLFEQIDGLTLNGTSVHRLPNVSNFSVRGVDGEMLLANLRDICISAGSACNSSRPEPSHVLLAMGVEPELALASIRVSVGRFSTAEDVSRGVSAIAQQIQRLRELA